MKLLRFLPLLFAAALLLTGCAAFQTEPPLIVTPQPLAAAPTPSPSPAPQSVPTLPPLPSPTPEPAIPDEWAGYLSSLGCDSAALDDCRQLVLALADGSEDNLQFYRRDESGLWEQALPSATAYFGLNGVIAAADKLEGDLRTPTGLYPLGFAFGMQPLSGLSIEYRTIESTVYWVDDPASAYYNQWVNTAETAPDWTSAEHMIDHDSYLYGLVIEYNLDPVVPGKGSAIFFHCGARSTTGCVSTDQTVVESLLRWLDPEANPHILIVG